MRKLYEALKSKCESEIREAEFSLSLCFERPTAIGEHTADHLFNEAYQSLDKLTSAKDRLHSLEEFFSHLNEDSLNIVNS